MYCPRCGAPNADATKFCRQCGLPLAEVTGYVASGGTGALVPPPTPATPATPAMPATPPLIQHPIPPGYELPPLPESSEVLALRQKRTLAILACVFLPILFAIIGDDVLHLGDVVAIPFVLMPLGIIWFSMRYKLKIRQLQEEQLRQAMAARSGPTQAPAQRPAPALAAPRDPVYQPPLAQTPTNTAPTNRFTPPSVVPSVVEDETRRLP